MVLDVMVSSQASLLPQDGGSLQKLSHTGWLIGAFIAPTLLFLKSA